MTSEPIDVENNLDAIVNQKTAYPWCWGTPEDRVKCARGTCPREYSCGD